MNTELLERVPAGIERKLAKQKTQQMIMRGVHPGLLGRNPELHSAIAAWHNDDHVSFTGLAGELIAAGLITEKQLPKDRGDQYATRYKLDGFRVECNGNGGDDYWHVRIYSKDGRLPAAAQLLLNSMGELPKVQAIFTNDMIAPMLALKSLSQTYARLPGDWASNSYIFGTVIGAVRDASRHAKQFLRSDVQFQANMKAALASLNEMMDFCMPIGADLPKSVVAIVVQKFCATLGQQLDDAIAATGLDEDYEFRDGQ